MLRFYNPAEETVLLTIFVEYADVGLRSFMTDVSLAPGAITSVEMPLSTLYVGKTVAGLRFQFGNTKTEDDRTIYFIDMVHYAK